MPGQPYGSPPPYQAPSPYGYGTPPPGRSNNKRTAWILGGIGGAIILLVVIVMVFVVGVGSSSDERAIKQVFADIAKANGSVSESLKFFCSEDQQMMKKFDPGMLESFGADGPEGTQRPDSVEITDVKVNGDRATAAISTDGKPDGNAYFRKEDGDWKLCIADSVGQTPPS